MFGPQASSPFRNGILLLLMVALFTCNTTLGSDGLQEMSKNRTSSNLTDSEQSMLRFLVTPAKGLGFDLYTFPAGFPDDAITNIYEPTGSDAYEYIGCVKVDHRQENHQCVAERLSKLDKFKNDPAKLTCQAYGIMMACTIKSACDYCNKDDFERLKQFYDVLIENLRDICFNYKSWIPSFTCTNWTAIIVIIVVLVIVAIGGTVAVVVVCCCCMAGCKGKGGAGGRSGSKRSSIRGSKSKLRKGSSKHRGSSRAPSRY